jgi:hypothetical protein
MAKEQNALCGRCKVALEVVTENDSEIGRCPQCGNSDTLDNVLRIVGDYALEKTAEGFDDAIGGAVRSSKFLQYTPAVRPKKSYRFIIDMDGHR